MSDYVPYEDRVRAQQASEAHTEQQTAKTRDQQLAKGRRLIRELAAAGVPTDSYLEILKPASSLKRKLGKTAIVYSRGMMGGPYFYVSEVVKAWFLPAALTTGGYKDVPIRATNAYVAMDARIWQITSGEGEGEGPSRNTFQVLAAAAQRLDAIRENDLSKVVGQLERRIRNEKGS